MEEILIVDNLKKYFGEVHAVDGVNLEIKRGLITSIIGPNGAGKTTFINLISGYLHPDSGRILFEKEDITNLAPRKIVAKGIARSFQFIKLFEHLSVSDNIRVTISARMKRSLNMLYDINKIENINKEAYEVLKTFGIMDKAQYLVSTLSHGDRKLLDIILAYVLKPKLLLLDEPTSGVSRSEKWRIADFIKNLARAGITICIVEHDLEVVSAISDMTYVMHEGKIIGKGKIEEVLEADQVKRSYLGLGE